MSDNFLKLVSHFMNLDRDMIFAISECWASFKSKLHTKLTRDTKISISREKCCKLLDGDGLEENTRDNARKDNRDKIVEETNEFKPENQSLSHSCDKKSPKAS